MSVDSVAQNLEIASSHAPDLRLLSDPQLAAIDAYGLRHPSGGPPGDIARPAMFLIDPQGRVAWRVLTENWRVRPRPEEVVKRVDALAP